MEDVVVIGSNSFSGGDFVDLLLDHGGYRVVGVSRSSQKSRLFLAYRDRADLSAFEFHRLDLNDDMDALLDLLAERQPAYVVNFASQSEVAPSWTHPEQWFQTNAVATARLGNFLKDCRWLRRYVHISTPEVYGSCEGSVSEDARMNPSTPYAASRAAGEMMLATLVKSFDLPMVVTRAANVYGAHQQLFKIIPRTAIYLKAGKTLQLHAGGMHRRSFIHIRDVSRAELAMMEGAETGEIFNISTEQMVSVRDVVSMICERMGKSLEECTESTADRVGQDSAYTLSSEAARRRFDWQPEVSLADGIGRVVAWVEREWDLIQREPLEYVHKA